LDVEIVVMFHVVRVYFYLAVIDYISDLI